MLRPRHATDRARWLPATSLAIGVTIPPFAPVAVSGTADGAYSASLPGSTSQRGLFLNGPTSIPPGGWGYVTNDFPNYARYDTTSGTPVIGDKWGSTAAGNKLVKGNNGFRIVGGINVEGGNANARVMVDLDYRCCLGPCDLKENVLAACCDESRFRNLTASFSNVSMGGVSCGGVGATPDTLCWPVWQSNHFAWEFATCPNCPGPCDPFYSEYLIGYDLFLCCTVAGWTLNRNLLACPGEYAAAGVSCNPLQVVFHNVIIAVAGNFGRLSYITASITITERGT
jgi:hypothetical protein